MTLLTEQSNPLSAHIDSLPTLDMLTIINQEDAKVAIAVQKALPAIANAVDTIEAAIRKGGRLIYAGAGTSGRLGILDAAECIPTYGTPPEMVQGIIAGGKDAMLRPIEGAEDHPEYGEQDLIALNLTENDVVCGIAASGRTPYVIGALEYANHIGAKTLAIACNVPSPILEIAQIPIGVEVGPEIISGSTRMKSGTAQKLILNMLSTGTMLKLGKVYGNLMVDVQITNQKLAERARRLVSQLADTDMDTAQNLLSQSNGQVKTAIVMHRLAVTAEEARQLLNQANGQLRPVIGEAKS